MMFKWALYFLSIVCLTIGCRNEIAFDSKNTQLTSKDRLELSKKLSKVYESDQIYRKQVAGSIQKYGLKSIEIQNLSEKIAKADSLNLLTVKSIVKKFGWLDAKTIGEKPSAALFLVIQHAPILERSYFLPTIKEAVKKGVISKKEFAFFEDRLALDLGRKQIYGTQMGFDTVTKSYYVFPIENPTKLDERRISVGLATIAVQMSEWNIKTNKND